MPRCKNCEKYYKGDEPSPKGKGYSACSEPIGSIKKGRDGKMWKVVKIKNGVKRWVSSRTCSKKRKNLSPRMNADDQMWTNPEWVSRINITDLEIEDEIFQDGKIFYNLSAKSDGNFVRFSYIYPNFFRTNDDGIVNIFDLMPQNVEVPYGTDIWVNISNLLDQLGIKYKNGKNFFFEDFEYNDDDEIMA